MNRIDKLKQLNFSPLFIQIAKKENLPDILKYVLSELSYDGIYSNCLDLFEVDEMIPIWQSSTDCLCLRIQEKYDFIFYDLEDPTLFYKVGFTEKASLLFLLGYAWFMSSNPERYDEINQLASDFNLKLEFNQIYKSIKFSGEDPLQDLVNFCLKI
ncbi:MAG: hypothetical protein NE327_02045 [Lentisphaeraceae bacterium]|nr:hypothetical protein [Lentisphaeraceae bacterium]